MRGGSSEQGRPLGARWNPDSGVDFHLWAPQRRNVAVVIDDEKPLAMRRDEEGYWSLRVTDARPGMLYRYLLDGDTNLCRADPASRFQPQGPEGPSEIIDPGAYAWTDDEWPGIGMPGQVLYELHVGSFSEAGTWEGALGKLPHLKELGVSVIEVMPIAEFPGEFGWGYDGVYLYAPYSRYGRPEALRAFVDAAHSLGMGVILDVVYNHFGPSGNYMRDFSADYFSDRETEWGTALNYDGPRSRPVRDFICGNAAYWIREYHLDGLRLDATQSMFDESRVHVIRELVACARTACKDRSIIVVAENEPQDSNLVRSVDLGGAGLDGVWNDDFHHSAIAALTGHREAYYTDYCGRAQEFVAAARHGFLYQGQYYQWQGKRRGAPTTGVPAHAFVAFIENHDQVANGACSRRTSRLSHPGAHRALTSLLLLGPWTPLLFQGQEWATARPFPFFAQHEPELAWLVQKGRREFLAQFPSLASRRAQECVPAPAARETFDSAKLDWSESLRTREGQASFALHRDLLELRRSDPILRAVSLGTGSVDGAVLTDKCLVLRMIAEHPTDPRLLIVNLGDDLRFSPCPEPLLAPPWKAWWRLAWCSDDVRYEGPGIAEGDREDGWSIPGYAALFFVPEAEAQGE